MSTATIPAEQFMQMARSLPVIDVRSPGEYSKGHIPGAFNIPLFTNEERAEVGTLYVQTGKEPAINLGQEIAVQKTDYYLDEIAKAAPQKQALLHCWRGGMRSAKIADLYREAGYRIFTLVGGYKAYRKYVRHQFASGKPIILIGGFTGSGKTEILNNIHKQGHQVIDLEALAHHKGSSFGHLGQEDQPTTEQFENDLFNLWDKIEPLKPLWLEHESMKIGNVLLPDTFYSAMMEGVLLFIEVPYDMRMQRILHEYGDFGKDELAEILEHLSIFMDPYQSREALKALNENDLAEVASITLKYYDKLYSNSLARRPIKKIMRIPLQTITAEEQAAEILQFAVKNGLQV